MSFCTQIKEELAGHNTAKPCCRRSLLYGLLYGSSLPQTKNDRIYFRFPVPSGSDCDFQAYITDLFQSQYHLTPDIYPETRGAHKYLNVYFYHKQIFKTLLQLSQAKEADQSVLPHVLGFRDPECTNHFVRGVFLAYGTISDPQKSYHLEIKAPTDGRADLLCSLFMNIDSMPGSTRRSGDVGFIWKSGAAVIELLNYMGVTSGLFDILNTQVEREIKNNENRATNCDTGNISRSISASAKYIHALAYLKDHHLLETLPKDLQVTAELRLMHPEISLRELADVHDPILSKSGLNHRLEKLLAAYEQALKSSIDT